MTLFHLRNIGAALAMFALSGCFPIELDVNANGELLVFREEGFFRYQPKTGEAKPITGPWNGTPVFGRFSPNGKDVLLVIHDTKFSHLYRFEIVPLDGGVPRPLIRLEDAAYASFSPDGKTIAAIAISKTRRMPMLDTSKGAFRPSGTDLHLIDVATGTSRVATTNVIGALRWHPSGNSLIAFQVTRGVKQDVYYGNVSRIHVPSGEVETLVAAAASNTIAPDLSPDGKSILFAAFAIHGPGDALLDGFRDSALHVLDVAKKKAQKVDSGPSRILWAKFSPKGTRILTLSDAEIISADQVTLSVADADLTKWTTVTTTASRGKSGATGGAAIPGWIGEDDFYYFADTLTYGSGIHSMALTIANAADGSRSRRHQAVLDQIGYDFAGKLPNGPPTDQQRPDEVNHDPLEPRLIHYSRDWSGYLAFAGVALVLVAVAFWLARRTRKPRASVKAESDPAEE